MSETCNRCYWIRESERFNIGVVRLCTRHAQADDVIAKLAAVTAERDAVLREWRRSNARLKAYEDVVVLGDHERLAFENHNETDRIQIPTPRALTAILDELAALKAQLERYRATLRQYGRHQDGCMSTTTLTGTEIVKRPCRCGLDALIAVADRRRAAEGEG